MFTIERTSSLDLILMFNRTYSALKSRKGVKTKPGAIKHGDQNIARAAILSAVTVGIPDNCMY